MKFILMLALSISPVLGLAQEKQVTELDMGACWVSEERPEFWKVASFNDRQAFVVDSFRLQYELWPVLATELKAQGITSLGLTDFQVHLHCSSAGHSLLINMGNASTPVCVHTDSSMSKVRVFPQFDGGDGLCFGVEPQSLMVTPKSIESLSELVTALKHPGYSRYIEDVVAIGIAGVVVVGLRPEFRFKEDQVQGVLLYDKNIGPLIESVDFNRILLISGSSHPLFSGTYEGY